MLGAIKAGLGTIAAAIGGAFSTAVAAISGMGLAELIKVGLIAGVSIAVIILIFKFLRDKWKMYCHRDNIVVETAVGRNYADLRQQNQLHPLMGTVRKTLRKDLKPRTKKGKKKYKDYLEKAYMHTHVNSFSDDDLADFRREFRAFKEGVPVNFGRVHDPDFDACSLRRVWPF